MTPEQQSLSSKTASPDNGSLDASSAMLAQIKDDSEHTLGGKLIGAIREHTIGKGSAQSNDQIATIAADTVAALPIVKSWVGGLARATVLVDPTKGLTQNLAGFGVNFAEGFALNKVSSLYNPESALSRFATAKLGTGIAAEGATHLAVGFGFGAVRAGFNSQSWHDQQGSFSFAMGAENILKDGGIGAAINLPAGLLGSRIAKASSLAMANESISARLANAIAGAGSGYAAGGVFGGLGAVMSGQSLGNVLKSANEGGIIGAVTGFGMGGLQSPAHSRDAVPLTRGPASVATEATQPLESAVIGDRAASITPPPQAAAEQVLAASRPVLDRRFSPNEAAPIGKSADLPLDIIPREYRIFEVTPRLHPTENTLEYVRYMPKGVKGPFKDWDDMVAASKVRTEEYRNYTVDGHSAPVSVPEAYARKLDQVRILRHQAEQPNAVLDGLTPVTLRQVQEWADTGNQEALKAKFSEEELGNIMPILTARSGLASHSMGDRALPEDLITLMDELPVKGNIERLTLLDSDLWLNLWNGQTYKPGFKAAASANIDTGEVAFYQAKRIDPAFPQFRDQLRLTLMHEDTHLAKSQAQLYEAASQLEPNGYHSSEYSKRDVLEREAEDRSIGFLNPVADKFDEFVTGAPIRASVIAKDLTSQMAPKPDQQGIYAKDHWDRIKYVQDNALPEAQKQLVQNLRHGSLEDKAAAVKLMSHLGNDDHAGDLMAVAHRYSSNEPLAISALDGALNVMGVDREAQYKLLWDEGQPDSPFRDAAIFRMRGLGSKLEDAAPSARLLEMVRDNDIWGVKKQIGLMRTDASKAAAYDYAEKLGADRPDYLRGLALTVLREQPQLRVQALHTLENLDPDGLGFFVKQYFDDRNPEVRRAAREIHARAVANSADDMIAHGEYPDSLMIRQLSLIEGSAAVAPLLKTAISGPEVNREAAVQALGGHSANLIKFYLKQLKMTAASPAEMQRLNFFQSHNPGSTNTGQAAVQ